MPPKRTIQMIYCLKIYAYLLRELVQICWYEKGRRGQAHHPPTHPWENTDFKKKTNNSCFKQCFSMSWLKNQTASYWLSLHTMSNMCFMSDRSTLLCWGIWKASVFSSVSISTSSLKVVPDSVILTLKWLTLLGWKKKRISIHWHLLPAYNNLYFIFRLKDLWELK